MYYSPFNQFQNYSIRQESITRVTGEEGAKAYQMAPNSSAALFDGNEDIFYLKTTRKGGGGYCNPGNIRNHSELLHKTSIYTNHCY